MYLVSFLNKEHAQQEQIVHFPITQIFHQKVQFVNTLLKEIANLVQSVHYYIQCPLMVPVLVRLVLKQILSLPILHPTYPFWEDVR